MSRLHNPWNLPEPMELETNSKVSESLKSEKSLDIPEFSFIQHLCCIQARTNWKRPAASSSYESDRTQKILSEWDSKTDPDSKLRRNEKVPRLNDKSRSKPGKKKTQKITWPKFVLSRLKIFCSKSELGNDIDLISLLQTLLTLIQKPIPYIFDTSSLTLSAWTE